MSGPQFCELMQRRNFLFLTLLAYIYPERSRSNAMRGVANIETVISSGLGDKTVWLVVTAFLIAAVALPR
jgi:hypothetical protein